MLDAEGETLSGIQYLKLKKSKPYATGYYFVRENGKVCTGKHFHTVKNQTANGKKYNGTYYFGGNNGKLYTKKGWTVVNGKKYYLRAYGKLLERWLLSAGERYDRQK